VLFIDFIDTQMSSQPASWTGSCHYDPLLQLGQAIILGCVFPVVYKSPAYDCSLGTNMMLIEYN